jgi:hypothetical protein
MSLFENPSFYISIFSSVCFIASELLPFIPVEGNGLLHAVLVFLTKINKVVEDVQQNKTKEASTELLNATKELIESNKEKTE